MEPNGKLTFNREIEALQAIRDELRIKTHLAKADIKDEWAQLENKWQHVEQELRRTVDHVKQPIQGIGVQTKELLTDLKRGYESILRQLS